MTTTFAPDNGTFAVERGYLLNGKDNDLTRATAEFSVGYWVGTKGYTVHNELGFGMAVEILIKNNYKQIGIWTDPSSGQTYVDGVMHVEDLIHAINLGRIHNQKAIWDIAHNTEIWV